MAKRNAPQTNAYRQNQRACEHQSSVQADKNATLEQLQNADLSVHQARRYMYNAATMRKGETVGAAFNRTYPELST